MTAEYKQEHFFGECLAGLELDNALWPNNYEQKCGAEMVMERHV